MNVSYIEPLRRAWARSRRLLFRPFVFRTWLVLGFAAFLSESLVTGHGLNYAIGDDDTGTRSEFFRAFGGVFAPAFWTLVAMLVLTAVVILAIALLWINSRGRFVFLDGVVRERAAIVEPWKRFARQGSSLFVWMILFFLVCAAIGLLMVLPFFASVAAVFATHEFHWGLLGALWLLVAVMIPFSILVAYSLLFLSDFVIPIMYRHGLGAAEAWRRFLALLRVQPATFFLYGFFVLALWMVVGFAITVIGFSTCCIGFALFGLPYVSSVVLLPVLVTFRGLGPEFLAQFGTEYAVLVGGPNPPEVAPSEAPPTGGIAPGAQVPPSTPEGGA